MIEIALPNNPVPWSPSRITKWGAFDPRGKDKQFTRWQIKSLYKGNVLDDYVMLDFIFFFPIPNSTSKKKRAEMLDGKIIPTQCDCTNLQKFYEDCLKKIVISDDRVVAKISSTKLYATKGKILIKIWTFEELGWMNEQ